MAKQKDMDAITETEEKFKKTKTITRTRLTYKIKKEKREEVYGDGILSRNGIKPKELFLNQFTKETDLSKKLAALAELELEYTIAVDYPKLINIED